MTNFNDCDQMLEEAGVIKPDTFPMVKINLSQVDYSLLELLDVQSLRKELDMPIELGSSSD